MYEIVSEHEKKAIYGRQFNAKEVRLQKIF